jgi:hypothetical protein
MIKNSIKKERMKKSIKKIKKTQSKNKKRKKKKNTQKKYKSIKKKRKRSKKKYSMIGGVVCGDNSDEKYIIKSDRNPNSYKCNNTLTTGISSGIKKNVAEEIEEKDLLFINKGKDGMYCIDIADWLDEYEYRDYTTFKPCAGDQQGNPATPTVRLTVRDIKNIRTQLEKLLKKYPNHALKEGIDYFNKSVDDDMQKITDLPIDRNQLSGNYPKIFFDLIYFLANVMNLNRVKEFLEQISSKKYIKGNIFLKYSGVDQPHDVQTKYIGNIMESVRDCIKLYLSLCDSPSNVWLSNSPFNDEHGNIQISGFTRDGREGRMELRSLSDWLNYSGIDCLKTFSKQIISYNNYLSKISNQPKNLITFYQADPDVVEDHNKTILYYKSNIQKILENNIKFNSLEETERKNIKSSILSGIPPPEISINGEIFPLPTLYFGTENGNQIKELIKKVNESFNNYKVDEKTQAATKHNKKLEYQQMEEELDRLYNEKFEEYYGGKYSDVSKFIHSTYKLTQEMIQYQEHLQRCVFLFSDNPCIEKWSEVTDEMVKKVKEERSVFKE